MSTALADAQINIDMMAASEIRNSCVRTEAEGIKAIPLIHTASGLGGEVNHQAQGIEAPVQMG